MPLIEKQVIPPLPLPPHTGKHVAIPDAIIAIATTAPPDQTQSVHVYCLGTMPWQPQNA